MGMILLYKESIEHTSSATTIIDYGQYALQETEHSAS